MIFKKGSKKKATKKTSSKKRKRTEGPTPQEQKVIDRQFKKWGKKLVLVAKRRDTKFCGQP